MIGNFIVFDFGTSFFRDETVVDLVLSKMPVSISLGLWTTLIVYLVCIPLGIRKAVNDGTRFDVWTTTALTIGFAIPSNMALNIVQRLLDDGGTVRRGFLGVSLREIDNNYARALGRDDLSGVLITEVHPDTPAEKSGMKPGDLIVGYNDKDVDGVQRLRLDISNTSPGTDVNFSVIRNGKEKDFSVELGDLEEVNLAGFTSPGREKPEAKPKELVEARGAQYRHLSISTEPQKHLWG